MIDYQSEENFRQAEALAKELILGNADWPDKVEITVMTNDHIRGATTKVFNPND